MVFFDEAGFMDDEAITTSEAFCAQNTEFKLDVDEAFNAKALKSKCPTQLVYASSAGGRESSFFRYYRDFYKRMLMGDSTVFVADMSCEVVLKPYCDGKEIPPLLTQDKIDTAMRLNPLKARREYYNKFDADGGADQMVKLATIRHNETFSIPEMEGDLDAEYVIVFDPARAGRDSSAALVMKMVKDEEWGWMGYVVNAENLVSTQRKKDLKSDTKEQITTLKQSFIEKYTCHTGDYSNLYALGIDSGAGGGGISAFTDYLLDNWKDKETGTTYRGFIDLEYSTQDVGVLYAGYEKKYPDANTKKLKLLNPKSMRTIMCEQFFELINNNLIKFPREYDGKGFVNYEIDTDTGEVDEDGNPIIETTLKKRMLSVEEERALNTIDLLKNEVTSINKYESNDHKTVTYKVPPEKEKHVHDDFFYCMIMAGHFLYEKRRQSYNIPKKKKKRDVRTAMARMNSSFGDGGGNDLFESIY